MKEFLRDKGKEKAEGFIERLKYALKGKAKVIELDSKSIADAEY